MNTRQRKKKKVQINKINKVMRMLTRKNKKKKRKNRVSAKNLYTNNVYDFLNEVKFHDIPIKDKLMLKVKNGISKIDIPQLFSLTKNPEETIEVLKKTFFFCKHDSVKKIVFNHKQCEELEIAASTIMDTIVMACKAHRSNNGKELLVSGNYPKDHKCRKIFIASGLPAHLTLQEKIPVRKDNIKLFSLVGGSGGSGRSGKVATDLMDYLNECLGTQGFGLTMTGQNLISKMFSEVIENCEIHGEKNTSWYVLGHFDMSEQEYGEVHLVIFNYGKSIFEKLLEPETTEETKRKLDYMRNAHKSQFDDYWDEEVMLTVFSLQKGVSRLRNRNQEGNRKRGTGTFRLLDTFYKLGNSLMDVEPEFSITSGHTHIVFDDKYKLMENKNIPEELELDNKMVIAFNDENDILKKADRNNVSKMEQYFPGTVIAMKFYIDRKYLQDLEGKK